ncbi:MAG: sulfotransferase domain-containing protein [Bacteroidota bacterium]|nr:sulfotransferase domain-containing protein [Bacteroidota bacterium]
MLIIAIPKSASTALMKTIGKLHFIEAMQLFALDLPVPNNLKILQEFHTDIKELDDKHAKIFSNETKIFKQHLPPTVNNIERLKSTKKVVLLREPDEIIQSYKRSFNKNLSSGLKRFEGVETDDEWIKEASKSGLKEDLDFFYNKWKSEEGKNTMIIYYKDLMSDAKKVINQIESFFDIPLTKKKFSLSKVRYSQTSKFGGIVLNNYQKIKSLFFEFIKQLGLYNYLLRFMRFLLSGASKKM